MEIHTSHTNETFMLCNPTAKAKTICIILSEDQSAVYQKLNNSKSKQLPQ